MSTKQIVLGVSTFFSLAATAMFCAGIAAASTNFDTLKAVPWVKSENVNFLNGAGEGDLYVGFTAAAYEFSGMKHSGKFDSCSSGDFCKECVHGGKTAMGLTAIALAFAIISLIVGLVRFAVDNDPVKYTHIVVKVISFTFAIAAWGNYSNCLQALEDMVEGTIDYGAGWIVTITASFLMIFGTIVVAAVNDNGSSPVPTADPTNNL